MCPLLGVFTQGGSAVVDSDGTASRPDLGWVSLYRCFETQTAVFGHVAVFVPGQLSLSSGVEGSQLHW